jgi:hypothetical protein
MATRRPPARKSPRTLSAARAKAAPLTIQEAQRRMEIRRLEWDLQEALFAKIDRLEQAAKRRGSRQRKKVARREHFQKHPPDEKVSAAERVEMMKTDQGVLVSRSAISKWLKQERARR